MKKLIYIVGVVFLLIFQVACAGTSDSDGPAFGIYDVTLSITGGSGKATVEPKSQLTIDENGMTVTVTWSSPNYDYMIVEGEKYLPVNTEGNSVFEIPVPALDEEFTVIGDTVAMSEPHEIEYTLTVSMDSDLAADGTAKQSSTTKATKEIDEFILENLGESTPIEFEYATGLTIDEYDGGFDVVTIGDEYYVICSKDNADRYEWPDDVTVISDELSSIYLVGTGSMDYFVAMDALSQVKYTSLEASDWHIDDVAEAMDSGSIAYAGKYSAPDYEMLCDGGCDLIVENNMITHSPEVLLQLQNLGFPVLIDQSSYESTALGRMEWIKLYGLLTGHLDEATAYFDKQVETIGNLQLGTDRELTVGFFSITTAGTVVVRNYNDYVADMIKQAKGKYAFDESLTDGGTGSTTIQMESFYEAAKDCDILIYNSTIEGEISDKDELASKCPLIINCRAFKMDAIYCTTASFYQAAMELGDITVDINKAINGQDDLDYLVKIK